MRAHCIFCRKFNFEQLLIETVFGIVGTFGSIQPQTNLLSYFRVLFKNGKSLVPLAPLLGEIKT